ncbi:MAG: SPFH domain-containing protein [Chloroflexota bacterium]
MDNVTNRLSGLRWVAFLIIGLVIIGFLFSFLGQFFYFLERVEEDQIGVRFRGGRIEEVVPAGVYSAFGLYVDVQTISRNGVPFTVTDPEIITKDKQRIGLTVSGDIFRPTDFDTVRNNWSLYRGIYQDDSLATLRVSDLARQAMKVCVGDRTFDDNIIGTARDDLRACVDEETNKLAAEFGLSIRNLVVPEVILSPEVQTALDAIVQSRLATEKAAQDEERQRAEALAEQARQEGEIKVEQSRIQEQARQQTQLAVLEQERLEAQLSVIEAERANDLARLETERQTIEAQKTNDLLAAEREIEINRAKADAAAEQAKASIAIDLALAELYAGSAEYLQLQIIQANASALQPTDKVIFTPEGTVPTLVLPGPGIVPTVDTSPAPAPVVPQPEPETEDGG